MAVTETNICKAGATVTIGSDLGTLDAGSGVTLTHSEELVSIGANVEQLTTDVVDWRTSEEYLMAFTLLEPTLDNIVIAVDSDNTITAPGAPTASTVDVGDNQFDKTSRVVAVTGGAPGGFTRTVTAPDAITTGGTEIKFTKAEATALAMSMKCRYDSASSKVWGFSDATA